MRLVTTPTWILCALTLALTAVPSLAADYPAPTEGSSGVRDLRFHTSETLPELRLHYTTVGAPIGEPVLVLHGTTGSGAGFLTANFAGELLGPGQPLDASPCGRAFPGTTTTTWFARSTGWSPSTSACAA